MSESTALRRGQARRPEKPRAASISVVIPVKDDAEMLERCLAALRGQTRPPDEVIVVDNGCTDDSVAVALRFGARVVVEARPGITAAASRGYDAARGDIIARCDADSVPPSGWLARVEETLADRPNAVAMTGPATFYDLGPVARLLARAFYLQAYFVAAGGAVANVPLFGSNFAMRRDLWNDLSASVPRNDPLLHDDFDLSYRIPPTRRVIYDRHCVVGISGRPFRNFAAMSRRLKMAGVTMREHRQDPAAARWWRRFRPQRHAGTLSSMARPTRWSEPPV